MAVFKLYQVFSDKPLGYRGNTSTVVLLDQPLSDSDYGRIASDFNQPATTFLYPLNSDNYGVRWFAPDAEIGLCGHGSAAAFAFLGALHPEINKYTLKYPLGKIIGSQSENRISMSLEVISADDEDEVTENLKKGLGIPVLEHYKTANKNILVTDSEKSVREMNPDFALLAQLKPFGYAVTAPGDHVDFVSRTLVPKVGQLEDHATGSSHAMLTPFWADRLNKNTLVSYQLSPRGGKFYCEITENEVTLSGEFQLLAEGDLILE